MNDNTQQKVTFSIDENDIHESTQFAAKSLADVEQSHGTVAAVKSAMLSIAANINWLASVAGPDEALAFVDQARAQLVVAMNTPETGAVVPFVSEQEAVPDKAHRH